MRYARVRRSTTSFVSGRSDSRREAAHRRVRSGRATGRTRARVTNAEALVPPFCRRPTPSIHRHVNLREL